MIERPLFQNYSQIDLKRLQKMLEQLDNIKITNLIHSLPDITGHNLLNGRDLM